MTQRLPSRRTVLKLGGAAAAAGLLPFPASLAQTGGRHGMSVFGELKYPPEFAAFDYVNQRAPKGGRMVYTAPSWAYNQNPQTFNTFNSFILKGDAPPRMELCFDTLMVRALDEPDAVYGLVAESVEKSDDENQYTFTIRPEARFHDEKPLTAEDVAFSLMTLKRDGHPLIRQTIEEMVEAIALDERRARVTFSGKQSRQLPMTIAGLPILSKDYYTRYDFTQSTLTPPVSSGPYRVGDYEVGRYIEYERVDNWWAKDLPVSRGHYNFDVLRLEFFRDRQVAFEAFKKGSMTFREEFTSKTWATEYNFPAVQDGRVKQREFPDGRPSGAQGWFFNTRREKFSDPRVRAAIGFAFDFEWSNKNLFYDLYTRTESFFENSTMKAEGEPGPEELALLEPFRESLPEAVFGSAIQAPISDGSGQDRNLLRKADSLFREAGLTREGGQLVLPTGEPLTIEFLSNSPSFERVVLPYINNLKRLGVAATFRLVDPSQYQARINEFDFDVVSRRYSLAPTLGESIRQFWGSKAAETPGSNNLAGISYRAIDALIEKAIFAETRDEMEIAARALDRCLRAGYYWVPHWYKPVHTVAMWDIFGMPPEPPRYDFPVETTWWFDEDKAAVAGKAG
ncbi:ABC transporter substrate-binding protein [Rhizobiales bacterium]|uniref:extracellular solute-binding protein n=1 Tax=Hongsoonwoonella zoysiae TaxID=2821844 RepID=UPI0015616AA5|nr:extracellular solute-binding protein [Hongsoonwoonella zoysiae]NRG16553.1 ABC transporter substrate-binding protein [Hongsoonwoonella zoysiae]